MKYTHKKLLYISQAFLLVCSLVFLSSPVHGLPLGLPLLNRSISVSSAIPGGPSSHTFSFTPTYTASVSSIAFQYCQNSSIFTDACIPPPGLGLSLLSLTSQSGNTGFSYDNIDSTTSKIIISRASAPMNAVNTSYTFSPITNPSTPGASIYIRISLYTSGNATGSPVEWNAVAYSLQDAFVVGANVPPFIKLCVAITVEIDCSNGSGNSLDMGVFSNAHASYGTSQFSVATNDVNGYAVYILGTTLTSGNNVITALTTPSGSVPGIQQFGLNLRQNTIPPVGEDAAGAGVGTPTANYGLANQYMFVPGDMIATSILPTDYTRMTASYIANIPKSQAAGIYSSTMTYVAVAQF
jgi:hypothetical protein